jgi:cytochrome P450
MVMLAFAAANRDPAMFPDADRVIIDRAGNRNVAFEPGIHRYIGSSLARMEICVALEEWLKAVPTFAWAPGTAIQWSNGTVRGPRRLPLVLG